MLCYALNCQLLQLICITYGLFPCSICLLRFSTSRGRSLRSSTCHCYVVRSRARTAKKPPTSLVIQADLAFCQRYPLAGSSIAGKPNTSQHLLNPGTGGVKFMEYVCICRCRYRMSVWSAFHERLKHATHLNERDFCGRDSVRVT